MKSLRIIYMGTPDFAVPSLQRLVEEKQNVVAVITAPDKPQGRGRKLTGSPVKAYAESVGLPILQPTNLKSPAFLEELKSFQADVQIVVAFRMLPEAVWNMPPFGTFNLHASLLPQYRGAAPIHWAIINGEKETGLTTFFLKHEIDTGAIIFQEKEPITDTDTVGDLYERLMNKGAALVLKTTKSIAKGDYPQKEQAAPKQVKTAPKIFKETCEIDWSQPAQKIYDFIRGLSPFPGAWTLINGKHYKIYGAKVLDTQKVEGFETDQKTYLYLQTADNDLAIEDLQLQGKKRMDIVSFLRGNEI